MTDRPTVGVVRHQQFRPSETFIAEQARSLRDFQPLFVGRDAIPAEVRVPSVSVAEFGRAAVVAYTLTRRSHRLADVLARHDVTLLHAHFGVEGVYAAPLARRLRVPLVTTLHGFDVTISRERLLASRRLSWISYARHRRDLFETGALFVCVSEHIRRRAVEWGYPDDRIVVLPIGVDVDRIVPVPVPAAPRILHVARLVEKKGTATLLRAFAEVRRAVPDAELTIVGDGPLRGRLTGLAATLGVAAAVRFTGAASHPSTLAEVAGARLLCLPSVTAADGDQEGLGMVLLEAAAAARPVVGTRHGGIPEAVTDGVNGYLVAEHDATALAERLVALLRDQQLCETFGRAGRDAVVERFHLRRQTAKLEALYRTVL